MKDMFWHTFLSAQFYLGISFEVKPDLLDGIVTTVGSLKPLGFRNRCSLVRLSFFSTGSSSAFTKSNQSRMPS